MQKTMKITPGYIKHLISEERELLAENTRLKYMLILEGTRMKAEGMSGQRIDEGLIDMIKSLGGGFIEGFKYEITLALLEKMGLHPEGFLARAIANTIENADIMEFRKYFAADTGCQELAELIMKSMEETGIEPLVDGFMSGLGVPTDSRIYVAIREALSKSVFEGDMSEYLHDNIAEWVCSFDVSNIVDMFKSGLSKTGGFFGGGSSAPATP